MNMFILRSGEKIMREALRKTQYMQANGGQPPPPDRNASGYGWGDKLPTTPDEARSFFFTQCINYGIGLGAAYGTGVGLFIFIIGAFYGAPIGAILGLILGIFDGIVLGNLAAHLVRTNESVPSIARRITVASPLITMAAGGCLLAVFRLFTGGGEDNFTLMFERGIYIIAVLASWHAGWLAARKFTVEYQ